MFSLEFTFIWVLLLFSIMRINEQVISTGSWSSSWHPSNICIFYTRLSSRRASVAWSTLYSLRWRVCFRKGLVIDIRLTYTAVSRISCIRLRVDACKLPNITEKPSALQYTRGEKHGTPCGIFRRKCTCRYVAEESYFYSSIRLRIVLYTCCMLHVFIYGGEEGLVKSHVLLKTSFYRERAELFLKYFLPPTMVGAKVWIWQREREGRHWFYVGEIFFLSAWDMNAIAFQGGKSVPKAPCDPAL